MRQTFLSKTFANSLNMQKQFEKSNEMYSLSIRVHTTKNHISICFLPHNINVKENVFFRARAEKGIV